MSGQWYHRNPLIHQNRRKTGGSTWRRSFDCSDVQPLIICRGPIRIEAMTVFEELGIEHYGILLSEKDSITYTEALSPELRKGLPDERVHRVPDYSGATKEERLERIHEIVQIAHAHNYNAVFAGYGFMAEDETLVSALEDAGLNFIGPCSRTVRSAGNKDLAKRTAIAEDVSVTPGVDNATELTLERLYPDKAALSSLISEQGFDLDIATMELKEAVSAVLETSYEQGVDLFSIDDLSETLTACVADLMRLHPRYRIRLKAIGGGGGKGQRILDAPSDSSSESIDAACGRVDTLFREILSEVRAGGVGDNKNVLAELNIETVRHVEIQVVGNGEWCLTMGGRDCSVQMNEQKLLELSLTVPELEDGILKANDAGQESAVASLKQDLATLTRMEEEAVRFGAAVGLDSVSTFECIVDQDNHFFMEMNTRVQVEHRVSELCYSLRFINPEDHNDRFEVDAIIELMVLLARHGARLPCPERIRREGASAEIRLNASDDALRPHAGGVITDWSSPLEGEIRDDQGICLTNPDTDMFMRYHLAGAYDSNIALELTTGLSREDTFERAATILRKMKITGENLSTNLNFHYGLINWFTGQNVQARPATSFTLPYLTAVGQLTRCASDIDLSYAWRQIEQRYLSGTEDASHNAAISDVMARKSNLVIRAVERLLDQPHYLAGWLARYQGDFTVTDRAVSWHRNRLFVLADIYEFLNMLPDDNTPALYTIWPEDLEILETGLSFIRELSARDLMGPDGNLHTEARDDVVGAHAGHQIGLELLNLLPYIADRARFFELRVNADLTVELPNWTRDPDTTAESLRYLSPPPVAAGDEISAPSGGMFYSREAPDRPPLVEPGDHFETGDDLCVIEVMKMFNKVRAPFSGTIDKVLIGEDQTIIKKGQPIFKVTPDEIITLPTPDEMAALRRSETDEFLRTLRLESDDGARP